MRQRKFKQITDAQRHTIQTLVDKGFKAKDLIDIFDFHRSTIYRELKRGKVKHLRSDLAEYVTYSADRAIDQAKINESNTGD